MSDAVEIYRRIAKAAKRGTGIRLCWAEASAIMRDDAVTQAIASADEYERIADHLSQPEDKNG